MEASNKKVCFSCWYWCNRSVQLGCLW